MSARAGRRPMRRNRRPNEIVRRRASVRRAPLVRRPSFRTTLTTFACLLIGGGVGVAAVADGRDIVRRVVVQATPAFVDVVLAADKPVAARADEIDRAGDVVDVVPTADEPVAARADETDRAVDVDIDVTGGGAAADEVTTRFTRRPYVAIGGGAARVEPRSPSAALTVAEDVSPAFEIGLGYDITRWLSAELHAADLGAAEIEFLGTDVGELGYQVYGASALFYLFNTRDGFVPFSASRDGAHRREGLSFFGRFGVGGLSNDSDRVAYRRDHATHAVFGAGLEYGFRNGFALRAELQAFDTDARYVGVSVLKRFGRVPVAAAAAPAVAAPAAALPPPVVVPPPEPPALLDALDMPIVYFAFDRSDLSARAIETLDEFAEAMEGDERIIAIDGHTDWIGPEVYNEGLSDRRADVVRDYLISRGMDPARLVARGFGETQPITRNTTEEGRSLNRRTEIRPEEE